MVKPYRKKLSARDVRTNALMKETALGQNPTDLSMAAHLEALDASLRLSKPKRSRYVRKPGKSKTARERAARKARSKAARRRSEERRNIHAVAREARRARNIRFYGEANSAAPRPVLPRWLVDLIETGNGPFVWRPASNNSRRAVRGIWHVNRLAIAMSCGVGILTPEGRAVRSWGLWVAARLALGAPLPRTAADGLQARAARYWIRGEIVPDRAVNRRPFHGYLTGEMWDECPPLPLLGEPLPEMPCQRPPERVRRRDSPWWDT